MDAVVVVPLVMTGTEVLTDVVIEVTLAKDGTIGTGVVMVDSLGVLGVRTLEAGGTPGVMVAI